MQNLYSTIDNPAEHPSFQVSYSEPCQLITVQVEGLVTEQESLEMLHKISDQLNHIPAQRILINASKSRIIPSEAIKWQSEHYLNVLAQELTQTRKIKIARIEPVEIINRLQGLIVEKVNKAVASTIEFGLFKDIRAAQQWLFS